MWNSHGKHKTWRLTPAWQATEKIKVERRCTARCATISDRVAAAPGVPLPAAAHIDTILGGSVTATWACSAGSRSRLTCAASTGIRTRNLGLFDRIAGISVRIGSDHPISRFSKGSSTSFRDVLARPVLVIC